MKPPRAQTLIERAINGIGSVPSLIIHTIIFLVCFALSLFNFIAWETMLLVLTTIVSLEAIYLALFIQITVNQNTASLREVEEDIDEIQEDVEELGEDLEDIQEDIEEISEDIDEIQEDVEEMSEEGEHLVREPKTKKTPKERPSAEEVLEKVSKEVQRILAELEALKEGK